MTFPAVLLTVVVLFHVVRNINDAKKLRDAMNAIDAWNVTGVAMREYFWDLYNLREIGKHLCNHSC